MLMIFPLNQVILMKIRIRLCSVKFVSVRNSRIFKRTSFFRLNITVQTVCSRIILSRPQTVKIGCD